MSGERAGVGVRVDARVESWRWQRLAEMMAIAQRRIWEREAESAEQRAEISQEAG